MFNNEMNTAAFIISIITVVLGSFTFTASSLIIIIIIYHLYKDRMKRETRITLILCTNIYLMVLIYALLSIWLNIDSILGDLYQQNFESSLCLFQGYFICVALCGVYTSFVVQAFYRLFRIVYSSYRWLQFFWLYVFIIPIQFLGACIFLSPLLVWHDVIYLPNEHYCFIAFRSFRASAWISITNYNPPLICLSLIYFRITKYIRQQSNNQTMIMRRRQNRDFRVLKRIITFVGILFGLGIPSIILVVISYITGVEQPLTYRVTWLSVALAMAVLIVLIGWLTPQLKCLLLKRWQRNQVIPTAVTNGDSVEMRTNRAAF